MYGLFGCYDLNIQIVDGSDRSSSACLHVRAPLAAKLVDSVTNWMRSKLLVLPQVLFIGVKGLGV